MVGQANTNSTAGASNFDGSITSSVRASQANGVSIVSYTGNGSTSSVGHNLNSAPKLYIIKNTSASVDWVVYTTAVDGSLDFGNLNTTSAFSNSSITAPTSSVFSVVNATTINTSGNNYIAYCFAPVAGFSAFGSYTGNGNADGPFVFTGMRPRWLLIKCCSHTGRWGIWDTERDSSNVAELRLRANATNVEDSGDSNVYVDILSNGFKLRNSDTDSNGSSRTYIYAAFAEHPLRHARAR